MAEPVIELAVGAVVHDDRGRLLVVRRGGPPAAGRWSLPGGRVEYGEPMREAVAREVAEETGLEVTVDEPVGFLEIIDDDRHYVGFDFRARTTGSDALAPGDDATDARWVTREELAGLDTTTGLWDFLTIHDAMPCPDSG